jgi:D-3-phosphoglycerate dehydrogenase
VPLAELYARADFVSLHVPLTPATRNLVGAAAFAQMRRGVYLVNAATGGIVDEAALLAALESGHVAGAALDVFAVEPPGASPLVGHPDVVATPHLSAATEEAQEKVAVQLAEQLVAFFRTGEVRNAVNAPEVPAELRLHLAPYLALARQLGALAGQLEPHPGASAAIEVEVEGEPAASARGVDAVTDAVLAGFMGHLDPAANEVNGRLLAAEHGVPVAATGRPGCDYAGAVTVRLRDAAAPRLVRGAVFAIGQSREPRLVQIDDFRLELVPGGRLLMVRAQDAPGVIGAIGSLLGARGVNVTRLAVGLLPGRGEALMLWNVDAEVTAAVLEEIRALPLARSAQVVAL